LDVDEGKNTTDPELFLVVKKSHPYGRQRFQRLTAVVYFRREILNTHHLGSF